MARSRVQPAPSPRHAETTAPGHEFADMATADAVLTRERRGSVTTTYERSKARSVSNETCSAHAQRQIRYSWVLFRIRDSWVRSNDGAAREKITKRGFVYSLYQIAR